MPTHRLRVLSFSKSRTNDSKNNINFISYVPKSKTEVNHHHTSVNINITDHGDTKTKPTKCDKAVGCNCKKCKKSKKCTEICHPCCEKVMVPLKRERSVDRNVCLPKKSKSDTLRINSKYNLKNMSQRSISVIDVKKMFTSRSHYYDSIKYAIRSITHDVARTSRRNNRNKHEKSVRVIYENGGRNITEPSSNLKSLSNWRKIEIRGENASTSCTELYDVASHTKEVLYSSKKNKRYKYENYLFHLLKRKPSKKKPICERTFDPEPSKKAQKISNSCISDSRSHNCLRDDCDNFPKRRCRQPKRSDSNIKCYVPKSKRRNIYKTRCYKAQRGNMVNASTSCLKLVDSSTKRSKVCLKPSTSCKKSVSFRKSPYSSCIFKEDQYHPQSKIKQNVISKMLTFMTKMYTNSHSKSGVIAKYFIMGVVAVVWFPCILAVGSAWLLTDLLRPQYLISEKTSKSEVKRKKSKINSNHSAYYSNPLTYMIGNMKKYGQSTIWPSGSGLRFDEGRSRNFKNRKPCKSACHHKQKRSSIKALKSRRCQRKHSLPHIRKSFQYSTCMPSTSKPCRTTQNKCCSVPSFSVPSFTANSYWVPTCKKQQPCKTKFGKVYRMLHNYFFGRSNIRDATCMDKAALGTDYECHNTSIICDSIRPKCSLKRFLFHGPCPTCTSCRPKIERKCCIGGHVASNKTALRCPSSGLFEGRDIEYSSPKLTCGPRFHASTRNPSIHRTVESNTMDKASPESIHSVIGEFKGGSGTVSPAKSIKRLRKNRKPCSISACHHKQKSSSINALKSRRCQGKHSLYHIRKSFQYSTCMPSTSKPCRTTQNKCCSVPSFSVPSFTANSYWVPTCKKQQPCKTKFGKVYRVLHNRFCGRSTNRDATYLDKATIGTDYECRNTSIICDSMRPKCSLKRFLFNGPCPPCTPCPPKIERKCCIGGHVASNKIPIRCPFCGLFQGRDIECSLPKLICGPQFPVCTRNPPIHRPVESNTMDKASPESIHSVIGENKGRGGIVSPAKSIKNLRKVSPPPKSIHSVIGESKGGSGTVSPAKSIKSLRKVSPPPKSIHSVIGEPKGGSGTVSPAKSNKSLRKVSPPPKSIHSVISEPKGGSGTVSPAKSNKRLRKVSPPPKSIHSVISEHKGGSGTVSPAKSIKSLRKVSPPPKSIHPVKDKPKSGSGTVSPAKSIKSLGKVSPPPQSRMKSPKKSSGRISPKTGVPIPVKPQQRKKSPKPKPTKSPKTEPGKRKQEPKKIKMKPFDLLKTKKKKNVSREPTPLEKTPKKKKGKMSVKNIFKTQHVQSKAKKKKSSDKFTWKDVDNELADSIWPPNGDCSSLYLITWKSRPHFWFFGYFPKLYPSFVRLYKGFVTCGQYCLVCLSICLWSPVLTVFYLCFKSCKEVLCCVC